jgi:hypothetical protein
MITVQTKTKYFYAETDSVEIPATPDQPTIKGTKGKLRGLKFTARAALATVGTIGTLAFSQPAMAQVSAGGETPAAEITQDTGPVIPDATTATPDKSPTSDTAEVGQPSSSVDRPAVVNAQVGSANQLGELQNATYDQSGNLGNINNNGYSQPTGTNSSSRSGLSVYYDQTKTNGLGNSSATTRFGFNGTLVFGENKDRRLKEKGMILQSETQKVLAETSFRGEKARADSSVAIAGIQQCGELARALKNESAATQFLLTCMKEAKAPAITGK